jgi:hypothetical protein
LCRSDEKTRGGRTVPCVRTVSVRFRHRTEYNAPNGPGSVCRRTATVSSRTQPHATRTPVSTPVQTRHGPRVLAQAPPAISQKHTRHALSAYGVFFFSPWQGQTQPIKNERALRGSAHSTTPPVLCSTVTASYTRTVLVRTR